MTRQALHRMAAQQVAEASRLLRRDSGAQAGEVDSP